MRFLPETLLTLIKEHQTITTHNANRHCRVLLYACVRKPLPKRLYMQTLPTRYLNVRELGTGSLGTERWELHLFHFTVHPKLGERPFRRFSVRGSSSLAAVLEWKKVKTPFHSLYWPLNIVSTQILPGCNFAWSRFRKPSHLVGQQRQCLYGNPIAMNSLRIAKWRYFTKDCTDSNLVSAAEECPVALLIFRTFVYNCFPQTCTQPTIFNFCSNNVDK